MRAGQRLLGLAPEHHRVAAPPRADTSASETVTSLKLNGIRSNGSSTRTASSPTTGPRVTVISSFLEHVVGQVDQHLPARPGRSPRAAPP